jgi:hypothetical protein
LRDKLISAGFALFGATGIHRLAAPLTRGLGAILMFHHVRPWREQDFAPNRILEITPAFLDTALAHIKASDFEIVSLDAALERSAAPGERPFVVLTFDDGYRDNVEHALPVLEKHGAPFTMFVTSGFADRTARLWWVELEQAIGGSNALRWTALNSRHGTPWRRSAPTRSFIGRDARDRRNACWRPARACARKLGSSRAISPPSFVSIGPASESLRSIRWRQSACIRSPIRCSRSIRRAERTRRKPRAH